MILSDKINDQVNELGNAFSSEILILYDEWLLQWELPE